MFNINNVKLIEFDAHASSMGSLYVYDTAHEFLFTIARVFVVDCHEDCTRGQHAHKACGQLLICLKGSCVIIVSDGKNKQEFFLATPNAGLFIPPTLWAEQAYQNNTLLMVLSDQPFDEQDYIRDYEEYIRFRSSL